MADNHFWHEVSEEEKETIRKEAKTLLEEFGKKLESITISSSHFTHEKGYREEGEAWNTDEDFRSITFANAPFVQDNSIVAEKGGWHKK